MDDLNPENICQVCKRQAERFGWTVEPSIIPGSCDDFCDGAYCRGCFNGEAYHSCDN